MPKPDFFIVGAPKCGTTALCKYLEVHPEVYIPPLKELYYFCPEIIALINTEVKKKERARTLEEYLSFFDRGEGKICGEGSVFYLVSQEAASKIKAFNPDAKIIIMLREPVSLIYSFYSMNIVYGVEKNLDFEQAVEQGILYRDVVKFTEQVQRYFDCFGRDRVQIIIFDDFQADTAKIYRETLEFLGVEPNFTTEFAIRNPNRNVHNATLQKLILRPPEKVLKIGKFLFPLPQYIRRKLLQQAKKRLKSLNTERGSRPSLPLELQIRLQQEFAPEIENLSNLLGRDLTHWSRGS